MFFIEPKNKLNVESLENVSGGSSEQIMEIRELLLSRYDIPENDREAYPIISRILRDDFDIDIFGTPTYLNEYRKIHRGIPKEEISHQDVLDCIKANL